MICPQSKDYLLPQYSNFFATLSGAICLAHNSLKNIVNLL